MKTKKKRVVKKGDADDSKLFGQELTKKIAKLFKKQILKNASGSVS